MKANITKLVAAILISLVGAAAAQAQLIQLPNTQPQQNTAKGPDLNKMAAILKRLDIAHTMTDVGNQKVLNVSVKLKSNAEFKTIITADHGSFWIVTNLAQVPQGKQLSQAQAVNLLEMNLTIFPCFFAYHKQSGNIAMMLEIPNADPDDKGVLGNLEFVIKHALDTQKHWTVNTDAPVAPMPPPLANNGTNVPVAPILVPTVKPMPNIIPVQPNVITLANTMWVGQENLQGFGKLGFEFQTDTSVIMHDTAGATKGVYRVTGNQVTLTFGGVTYQAAINGTAMNGIATNGKTNWQFSVSVNK